MGLGAKNDGSLTDKHYRRIFRSQQEMYSNPEDEDYAMLYQYNIMPWQIKRNVEKYSADFLKIHENRAAENAARGFGFYDGVE